MKNDCLFCAIAAGEIPSNKVYEDELCYAFRDIAPQAPTHFLVIPKAHIASVSGINAENSAVVAHIFEVIAKVTKEMGIESYRVVSNIGEQAGQSVPQPIPIISEDTAAHGVEKVIFKKLSHKGENKRGQLTATLELWEYIPQTITAKSGSSSGSGKSGGGAASNLKADYKSYLSNERGKSPARDDADATAAMNKVTAMPY